MTDRYHGHSHTGRTAAVNPARTSLPASIGYTSLYAGDMHVMPSSTRQPAASAAPAPREYVTTTTTTSSSAAPTTTRTYAVTQDPRSQRPTTRDVTRGHRSSTLDSASGRPPVIIMTTQKDRTNTGPSYPSNARSGSPTRDDFRASEGQLYTQPASSIRSRSTARPYSEHFDSDDFARTRDRSDSLAQADAYRSTRPSVVYPSNPRHSTATIDYGDDGYMYTNAGELVRYDLEHPQSSRSRRRESFDRGYYRPNINYNADQQVPNVVASPTQDRNYITTTRQVGTRGGPPPSTRGFDKIPRAYDAPPPSAPVIPVVPVVPEPSPAVISTTTEGRRPRPVSLYQEGPPRSQHHDDYYRSREDEKTVREQREQQREPGHQYGDLTYEPQAYETPTYETQPGYFHDDRVTTRGFGIRTDSVNDRRDSYKPDEPKKRSDENIIREQEPDYEERRRSPKESRRERRESKRGDEEEQKERSRFRDKISSGLGIAAAAVGITPLAKSDDKRSKDDSRGRRGSDDDRERKRDSERSRSRASPRDRSRLRDYDRKPSPSRDLPETKRLSRTDSRRNSEAVVSPSDSDEGKRTTRRNRLSNAFNPNDASELNHLKEQLAALKTTDVEKDKPVVIETRRNRSRSPSPIRETKSSRDSRSPPESRSTREARSPIEPKPARESYPPARESYPPAESKPAQSKPAQSSTAASSPGDESRGRELTVSAPEEKQVRVVSPPRDKKDEKPLRGILKQPKVSFPEDPNPIREGVAPHKEDKKIKDAPAGAKWTKISRKVVNPEALTIGKERFEVRDDFVIVLRVLSKEEIQAYASATQVLRERRRQDEDERERERERDQDKDKDRERDRDRDDDKRKHRHRRHRDDDDDYDSKDRERDRDRDRDREKDRDRDRRRRHRDDDDYESRSKDQDHHHHHHHHY